RLGQECHADTLNLARPTNVAERLPRAISVADRVPQSTVGCGPRQLKLAACVVTCAPDVSKVAGVTGYSTDIPPPLPTAIGKSDGVPQLTISGCTYKV